MADVIHLYKPRLPRANVERLPIVLQAHDGVVSMIFGHGALETEVWVSEEQLDELLEDLRKMKAEIVARRSK